MPDAIVADDTAKLKFKTEGRQLYSPPVNPNHNPLPEIEGVGRPYPIDVPFCEIPGYGETFMWPLTATQYYAMKAMHADADEARARTLNVEEIERSIALCEKCGVGVPRWMRMGLDLLKAQRAEKYPAHAKSPEA